MMYSLRTRLALGTAIGTSAVLLTGGMLLYLFTRGALLAQLDRSLVEKAGLLASTVEAEFGEIELDFPQLDMREFEKPGGPGFLQLWNADGTVLFRSLSLGNAHLALQPAGPPSAACGWTTLPGGQRGRSVSLVFTPSDEYMLEDKEGAELVERPATGQPMTLVVARSTAGIDATLGRLRALLLIIGPLTVLLSVGVLYCTIRGGLRPLDDIAGQIRGLGETDLSVRIDGSNAPAEIQPVVERLNDLLARLEDAFQRERAFSADIAHELRTPLAGARAALDVALARDRSAQEYREALAEVQEIASQMQGMVEKLLSLSHLEARQVAVRPEALSLDELLQACWKPLADAARARRVDVRWNVDPQVRITTDRRLLEMAVSNILENAVTYAEEGGTVSIELGSTPEGVDIRVSNTGSGLSEEQAEHVFDRFWRADAARSAAGVHSGLGLPVVQRIADVLGATVQARSRPGHEFTIVLTLPAESPAPEH